MIMTFVYVQVWLTVSGAEALREEWGSDFYQKLLNGPMDQDIVDIVKTDLPRTFPDNIFFSTEGNHQQQLYNILVAYAHDNHQVGYCQVCCKCEFTDTVVVSLVNYQCFNLWNYSLHNPLFYYCAFNRVSEWHLMDIPLYLKCATWEIFLDIKKLK